MYKLILLSILFFLIVLKVNGQSIQTQSSRDLLLKIQRSSLDTTRISLLLKLGDYYQSKALVNQGKIAEFRKNQDSAIHSLNRALNLSINLNETDRQYLALDKIAECEIETDPAHSKMILRQEIAYFHQQGNLKQEARGWKCLADAFYENYKFNDGAQEKIGYYQNARKLYLQNYEPIAAAGILIDIAGQEIRIGQLTLAEQNLQQSISEYKAIH